MTAYIERIDYSEENQCYIDYILAKESKKLLAEVRIWPGSSYKSILYIDQHDPALKEFCEQLVT